jgi:nucleotide-binding universal stress UspA family protein
MRLLLASDGSEAAISAARRAVALWPEAEPVLVSVSPPPLDPEETAGGIEGPVIDPEEAELDRRESRVEADGALAATAIALGRSPVPGQFPLEGDPGPTIASAAEDLLVDVVVVGQSEKSLIERAVLGSVSTSLIRNAPCPVLVVRDGDG